MDTQSYTIVNSIKLIDTDNFYNIRDEFGNYINRKNATPEQLTNHWRHNCTNYDEVLDDIRDTKGFISGHDIKCVTRGVLQQVGKKLNNDALKAKADYTTEVKALESLVKKQQFDSQKEYAPTIKYLSRSKKSLQVANDTYRAQRELIKKLINESNVSDEIKSQVEAIYSTRSVDKAIEKCVGIFDLEKSELLQLIKRVIRY